jgi:hypothetical protein
MTRKNAHVGFSSDAEVVERTSVSLVSPRAELPEAVPEGEATGNAVMDDVLGEPLSIREVAQLIGCSVWTVRQQCLRQGLPHFRVSRTGRLIFYRNQVIRWLIHNQQERRPF